MKKRMYSVYKASGRRSRSRRKLWTLKGAVTSPGMSVSDYVRRRGERSAGEGIRLPVSKSQAARYLVASYWAGTLGYVRPMEACEDVRVIHEALLQLEFNEEWLGVGEPPMDLHASGTAFRFMMAVVASTPGSDFLLTGIPRLCDRPMGPLVETLSAAGASIEARGAFGTGPYRVIGRRLRGGILEIPGNISSQFISAMMLCAPMWKEGMRLKFTSELVSFPYVLMTERVLRDFGVSVRVSEQGVEIPPCDWLAPTEYLLEADWSSAAFFFQYMAGEKGDILLRDLPAPENSLQGDSVAAALFRRLGVEAEFSEKGALLRWNGSLPETMEKDMSDFPDLVPALVMACLYNEVPFRFTGVAHLRHKESDRLDALVEETMKTGFILESGDDSIAWEGKRCRKKRGAVNPRGDHRIAMAFAVFGRRDGICICDAACVDKSFPDFWQELATLGVKVKFKEGKAYI